MPRWLTGALAGIGVGILAGLVTLFLTGPGHGSDVPAVVMFPIMRLLVAHVRLPVAVVAGIGLLQYPVYGAVTGLTKSRLRGLALVATIHVAAAVYTLYILGLMAP
jgi:hypothetical protein